MIKVILVWTVEGSPERSTGVAKGLDEVVSDRVSESKLEQGVFQKKLKHERKDLTVKRSLHDSSQACPLGMNVTFSFKGRSIG